MRASHSPSGAVTTDYRVLGPVQVRRHGRSLPVGGPKQRAVLALLLIEAPRVVPTAKLIEERLSERHSPMVSVVGMQMPDASFSYLYWKRPRTVAPGTRDCVRHGDRDLRVGLAPAGLGASLKLSS